MLKQIKDQIKRLGLPLRELWPQYKAFDTPQGEKTIEDHEEFGRLAMAEISKMQQLLTDILERDQEILYLFLWFYVHTDIERHKLHDGTVYAITSMIEKIAGDDKMLHFLKLYEEPTRGGIKAEWPTVTEGIQNEFDAQAKNQRLHL